MADVYITGTISGATSTAYHMWMGSVTGTPTQIEKTSNNTYTIDVSWGYTCGSSVQTLIQTDGTIESYSSTGATNTEVWSSDEICVHHYGHLTTNVTLSSSATWLSIRVDGVSLSDGTWPTTTYLNGVDFGANFIRWNLKNPVILNPASNLSVSHSGSSFSVSWIKATGSGGTGSITETLYYGDSENGYGTKSIANASSPRSITRWVTPTWNDITYRFSVTSSYSGKTTTTSKDITLTAPYISWASKALTIEQVGNQVKVSWNAATLNNNYSSQSVKYTISCSIKGEGDASAWTSTTTASSITFTPPAYDTELFFQVYAWADNVGGGVYSTGTYATIYSHRITTAPVISSVSLSGSVFTVKWSAATGAYAASGTGITYKVFYGDSQNGYGKYSTTATSSTSVTINRWVVPTQSDITYRFYVVATYSTATSTSATKDYALVAPSISWTSKNLTISQVNNQVKVSWNAATINNNYSSHTLKYTLVCQLKGQGTTGQYTTTTTSTSVTFTPPAYNTVLFFQVTAFADNVSGSVYSTSSEATFLPASVTAPGKPTVTLSGNTFKISWTASTGQYGAAGSSVWYRVHYFDSAGVVTKSYSTYVQTTTNSAEITKWVSASTTDITCSFFVVAFYDVAASTDSAIATYTLTAQNPTITAQPSITSVSPTSGLSTTIKWSAATVSNQGTATIYYQYFVGPSSTYSDSYHVGTTTSLYATITEANILAKCGSTFDGTCYLFVRAYWDKDGATGGWSVPIAKTFTYTPHRTVKYYDGSGWVECIVFYYDGTDWRECIPYRYNGTGWDELSH